MPAEILASRRKTVIAAVNAFPGGRECAATYLGLDLKRFDNQLYENPGHRPLTDEQVHQLEQVAGTTLLANYLCNLYGGVFVALPKAEQLDNLDLYSRALASGVAEGKVNQIISQALLDGSLDEAELAEIVAAHRNHIATRHAEVNAVITLHRK